MKRTTALLCGLVVAVSLFTPVQSAEACGGAWELACWEWTWCLFRVLGVCVPGLRLVPPDGCDPRMNNILGLCTPCGGAFQPICIGEGWNALCNNDRRYTPALLCIPCGRSGEPICLSSPVCDPYNRIVYGFCSYSGHSAEPWCNCDVGTVPTQPSNEPVRGFADIHMHQFSNLALGGAGFWGDTHHPGGIDKALPWCDWTWKFPILPGLSLSPDFHPTLGFKAHGTVAHQWVDCPADDFGISVSCNSHEGVHAVSGTGPFEGWPKWSTTTHQQMYYKWLERAYKGGLRLMVQLAVNNELACLISGKRWLDCRDMYNIDKQIDGAYALEAFIDQQHGGPGKGWYRIVTSPGEARRAIEDGKLAVVLGIETDSLFGCKPLSGGCTEEYIQKQVEKYYCKGVRHIFPVHLYNNKFAGSALYNDFWTIANFFVTLGFMDPWDCSTFPDPESEDPLAKKYNYQTKWVQGLLAFYNFVYGWTPLPDWGPIGAHCNQRGLTDEGWYLINDLMDYGMIIDTDHLSLLAMEDVLWYAELRNYPLVAGHAFLFDHPPMEFGHLPRTELHRTAEQIKRIRDIGGIIAPLDPHGKCSSTLDYAQKYKYIVEQMSGGPFYEDDGFPRIAFATDFGGFFQQTAPRNPRESGDYCPDSTYLAQKYDPKDKFSIYEIPNEDGETAVLWRPDDYPLLQYPFNAVGGFGTFWKQQTGDRVFDFNRDGLAHVGLLPDFMADLRNFGLTDADLEPMMYSAEAYLRMWEQVDISGGAAVPRVVAEIDGTEGDGEWYVSDVVVSWYDQCDASTIDYDTTGVDVSCTVQSPCGPVTTSVIIQRDATPPTVTDARIVTTTAPLSGWYKEIVQVAFEAEDLTSGLFGGSPITVSVNGEGEDLVASYEFRDQAGNTVLAELGGINIDMTPPLIGFRFEHAPDLTPEEFEAEVQAWHNFDVVFEVFARDELSGIESVDPERLVVSAEGISVAGSATATDVAGNSSTATSPSVKIDKTPPTIAFVSRQPEANEHGWNNSEITVTWSCEDGLSGVVEEVVTQTLSTDGADQSLTGQCVDQAGNIAEDTVAGLNLDMTPPLLACAADPSEMWPANHKMVPVTIAIDFSDPISGTDGFWLTAVVSNEPDSGNRGDKPIDIQGFDVGIDDTAGELRAERDGKGQGRIYTFDYAGQDAAGNGATCTTAVAVPHDQGNGKGKD
jgi:microsomal dipeptidase-like Zn-dependent dipeptidase